MLYCVDFYIFAKTPFGFYFRYVLVEIRRTDNQMELLFIAIYLNITRYSAVFHRLYLKNTVTFHYLTFWHTCCIFVVLLQ